mmetsp:Transcript_14599/g.35683  ORF Transcript_14599/g.35683 Transcript_14599/m.35683 type:complete len:287 (-) Transcript_14599:210-1070(-)
MRCEGRGGGEVEDALARPPPARRQVAGAICPLRSRRVRLCLLLHLTSDCPPHPCVHQDRPRAHRVHVTLGEARGLGREARVGRERGERGGVRARCAAACGKRAAKRSEQGREVYAARGSGVPGRYARAGGGSHGGCQQARLPWRVNDGGGSLYLCRGRRKKMHPLNCSEGSVSKSPGADHNHHLSALVSPRARVCGRRRSGQRAYPGCSLCHKLCRGGVSRAGLLAGPTTRLVCSAWQYDDSVSGSGHQLRQRPQCRAPLRLEEGVCRHARGDCPQLELHGGARKR